MCESLGLFPRGCGTAAIPGASCPREKGPGRRARPTFTHLFSSVSWSWPGSFGRVGLPGRVSSRKSAEEAAETLETAMERVCHDQGLGQMISSGGRPSNLRSRLILPLGKVVIAERHHDVLVWGDTL